jgi:toxin ParE1/3/4
VRVVWSLRALRELRDQRRYIARNQPDAAAQIAARIIAATDRLETYPNYGRAAIWDETGRIRELAIARTPFVVLYTIDEAAQVVVIVRVVHGAQLRGPV